MKITVTTTTIKLPYLIEDYAKDILNAGEEVDFVITGDKKSPPETLDFCKSIQDKYNVPVLFMGVDEQNNYMKKFPELDKFLPWNCIQRRNVAILKAYENGADVIILIDDDNFIATEDYVLKHANAIKRTKINAYKTDTGWFNSCIFLEDKYGRKFYPRGYAVEERIDEVPYSETALEDANVVVNAGFWLGDPDIDAATRLSAPIDAVKYNRGNNFALDKGVFCPFNSQNTALHRQVIPAYFLCPDIGRFDDIWSSYVVERIAWHLNDFVSYGQPLVRQDRNEHDLWVDAKLEEMGTRLTLKFCNWLRKINLEADNYLGCAIQLVDSLKQIIDNEDMPYAERAYFNHFIDGHKVWFKTMQRIDGNG